jgi:hypothetical protein
LLWKVSLGWTLKNSAVAVGINYDYAKEVLKKYNELGEKGVICLWICETSYRRNFDERHY